MMMRGDMRGRAGVVLSRRVAGRADVVLSCRVAGRVSVWRRWPVRVAAVAVCVVVGVAGYAWAPSAVAGLMTVRHVAIAGTARSARRDILELLALPKDSSLLWLDRARLARRVETHPWVASASVGRALPHTLSVVVVERAPAMVVRDADDVVFADRDGTALPVDAGLPTGRLPTVIGLPTARLRAGDPTARVRARLALDFAETVRARDGQPVTVDVGDDRFVSGRTGTLVFLVNHDFRPAWRRYLAMASVIREDIHRQPHEIDLRFADTLIVRKKGHPLPWPKKSTSSSG